MKTWKKYFLQSCIALFATGMLTACGSLSNMSEEDAWNVGYGAGTLLRNLIDN